MAIVKLNQLPAPTFSWLGVNGTEREFYDDIAYEKKIFSADKSPLILEVSHSEKIEIQSSDHPQFIIMKLNGHRQTVQTEIHAQANAEIKLVQIITDGDTVTNLHADLDDHAQFKLIQIYLNCNDAVSEIQVNENGRYSVFTCNIGYVLAGESVLDINLAVNQKGKKSVSNTTVKGVLRDHAKKIFRGTIDFRNGAVGASGTEQENVLLLDKNVINKTVPVILCDEEDVVGSHGATIGRIDPKQIYYMQSRGIPEAQIYEILAHSQISSIIKEIGCAEIEQTLSRLSGRECDDA